jgi:hypothetical protein
MHCCITRIAAANFCFGLRAPCSTPLTRPRPRLANLIKVFRPSFAHIADTDGPRERLVKTQPKPATRLSASNIRRASWRCSTGWENWASPAASANRQFERANCCGCIGKPIAFFWRWSDAAVDYAMLWGSLHTVFGWRIQVPANANPRSLRNFPMQANGAEMLRLACCLATERGIEVCAPVHDAVLICAPLERLDADVAGMQDAMREASRVVLHGFELGTEAKVVRYPDRYADPRGAVMWDRVMNLIRQRMSGTENAAA